MPGSICPTSSCGFGASSHEPATKGRWDLDPSGRAVIIDGGGPGNGRAPAREGTDEGGGRSIGWLASVLASVRLLLPQRRLDRGTPRDNSGVPTIRSGICPKAVRPGKGGRGCTRSRTYRVGVPADHFGGGPLA